MNWAQSLNGAQLGWVRATGLAPRVGSGYGKTRPEPDPLPFLSILVIFVIGFVVGCCVGASEWLALCYKVG